MLPSRGCGQPRLICALFIPQCASHKRTQCSHPVLVSPSCSPDNAPQGAFPVNLSQKFGKMAYFKTRLRKYSTNSAAMKSGQKPGTMQDIYDSNEFKPVFQKEQQKESNAKMVKVVIAKSSKKTGPEESTRPDVSKYLTEKAAKQKYNLSKDDIDSLPKQRDPRQTIDDVIPVYVYLKSDVFERAVKNFGSPERLRQWQKSHGFLDAGVLSVAGLKSAPETQAFPWKALLSGPGGVVSAAVGINFLNFGAKLVAWYWTGSHSMFAEAIHSLADTLNQLILAMGILASAKQPDTEHPYGYANFKYVASLISGVGIFSIGTGLSFYHGITALLDPQPLGSLYWAFGLLAGSFLSEGATLILAYRELSRRAREARQSLWDFVKTGEEPSLNVVFLEDSAAVLGVLTAAGCMSVSAWYGSVIPDAMGSLAIGSLLAGVAYFIIRTSSDHLVGCSINPAKRAAIIEQLEGDLMVRSVHDVKAMRQGSSEVRVKAEVKFDGKNVTRMYLEDIYGARHVGESILRELEAVNGNADAAVQFMLKHGEKIVDKQGEEIDRIEKSIQKKYPNVRHIDLEPM